MAGTNAGGIYLNTDSGFGSFLDKISGLVDASVKSRDELRGLSAAGYAGLSPDDSPGQSLLDRLKGAVGLSTNMPTARTAPLSADPLGAAPQQGAYASAGMAAQQQPDSPSMQMSGSGTSAVAQPTPKGFTSGTTPAEKLSALNGKSLASNNALIQDYLHTGGQNLNPNELAWCAAAVNASLQQSGIKGTGSNLAKSFLNFGETTPTPKPGDIAVFSRGDPNGPLGHVGFYMGDAPNGDVRVLAGNQGGGGVNERVLPASKLLDIRTAPGLNGPQSNPAMAYAPSAQQNAPASQAIATAAPQDGGQDPLPPRRPVEFGGPSDVAPAQVATPTADPAPVATPQVAQVGTPVQQAAPTPVQPGSTLPGAGLSVEQREQIKQLVLNPATRALGLQLWQQSVAPKDGFTLKPGEQRYDARGRLIVGVPEKDTPVTVAGGSTLVDPRTGRKIFEGEKDAKWQIGTNPDGSSFAWNPSEPTAARVPLSTGVKETKYSTFQNPDGTTLAYDPTNPSKPPVRLTPPDAKTGYQKTTAFKAGDVVEGPDGKPSLLTGQGTNVTVNNAVNPILKGLGEQFVTNAEGARAAADTVRAIQNARSQIEAPGGIISGQFANQALTLQKIGAALGVTDPAKIQNTETFRTQIKPIVLETVKGLGAGSGISNADRDFALQAVGGDITLDGGSIRRVLDITERAARSKVDRHNALADEMVKTQPDLAAVGPMLRIAPPEAYSPPSLPQLSTQPQRTTPLAAPATSQDGWTDLGNGVRIRPK